MGLRENGDLANRERDVNIHVVSSSESSDKDAENVEEVESEIDKGVYRAIMYWNSRKDAWMQEWISRFEVDSGTINQRKQTGKSTRRVKRKFYNTERARGATP